MDLLSIFKRRAASPPGAGPAGAPPDSVQRARTRARQRLIGALVLVAIGVIGFPLVFETQPRPIPVDIQIDIPRKEDAPALTMPPANRPSPVAQAPSALPPGDRTPANRSTAGPNPGAAGQTPQATPPGAATDDAASAGGQKGEMRGEAAVLPHPPTPRAASKPAAAQTAASGTPPVTASSSAAAPARAAASTEPAGSASLPLPTDGARARALLEGKPAVDAGPGRFVVQVGAFADAAVAHDTRLKVEKLGLKTYTQVAATPSGDRIRVRVGPFGTRDDADKALAKARSAGFSAVVIVL